MTERFLLQKSRKKPKGWVCTDTKYNIVCQFEEHKYKETRHLTFLDDIKSKEHAKEVGEHIADFKDWLEENHKDML